MNRIALPLALLALAACAPGNDAAANNEAEPVAVADSEADRFFASLTALCGKAYEGRVVSDEAADEICAALASSCTSANAATR